jgi:hypothetical protein
MKIDVVYTWVNGADENWKRKKLEYSQNYNTKVSKEAQSDARFMNNDELRYSIRSIFKYAPWINNIYIVTDNQIPDWLDNNCSKIKIIDHREIFKNHDFLPTFNSMAIEANLHHIPNLSEYFIYSNDDVFLGDYCSPEYFFLKDGSPRIFVADLIGRKKKWHLNADVLPPERKNEHQYSIINSRLLLRKIFRKSIYSEIRHGMKACRKSDLFFLEDTFNQQFMLTMSHKFRDKNDIFVYDLISMYSLLKGTGKRTYMTSLSKKSQWLNDLMKRIMKFNFYYIHLSSGVVDRSFPLIERNRPFMFCLNQFYDTPYSNMAKVQPFLEKYFPYPCLAEKSII